MYKVLITGFVSDFCWQADEIALLEGIAEVRVLNPAARQELLTAVRDVDAIMTDTAVIDDSVFEAAKNLKIVSEYGVGVDNIDLESATRHGVYVCNVPDVYTGNVAEHALALLMACAKRLIAANESAKLGGTWDSSDVWPVRIEGKCLGLVGCGRIGLSFLKKCAGLGMNAVVYDPYLPEDALKDMDVRRTTLEELLETCDILSVHVPRVPETIGLLNRARFASMKKGSMLINVSRGGIVDERALLWALNEGIVAAAGLDVLQGEPDIWNNPLRRHPHVLVTPHMGWKSETAAREVELNCAENVAAFLKDGTLGHLCNLSMLDRGKER